MKRLLILCGVIFAFAMAGWAEPTREQMASVVRILSVGGGTGTGFVISNDGLIMTNNHVIASDPLTADHPFTYIVLQKVGDRVIAHLAEFVAQDPRADLAVLRCSQLKLTPLQLLVSSPQVFQEVYSIGFPGIADETQVINGWQVGHYNGDVMNVIKGRLGQTATPLDITDLFPGDFKKHVQALAEQAAQQLQKVAAQLQEVTTSLSSPDILKKKAEAQNKKPEEVKKELEEQKGELEEQKKGLEEEQKRNQDFSTSTKDAQLTKFLQDFVSPTSTTGKIEKLTEGSVDEQTTVPLIEHSCNIRGGNSGGPLLNGGGQVLGVVGDGWQIKDEKNPHKGEGVNGAIQATQVQKFLQASGINNCFITDQERIPKPNNFSFIAAASIAVAVALAALLITLFKARRKTGMTALLESLKNKGIRSGTQLLEYIGGRPGRQSSPSGPSIVPPQGNGWKLDVRTSTGKTFQIPISESMFTTNSSRLVVGRSRDLCDLVVEDETVSRQHAEIRKNGPGFMVADRNSSNGTAVNGVFNRKPFEAVPFKPGDTLTIGDAKLDFR